MDEQLDLDAYARGMEGSSLAAGKWTLEQVLLVDKAIELAADLGEFTADDVWPRCPTVPVTKGLAARLNAARNRGLIESTGRVTFARRGGQHDHRQRLTVWRRA